MYYDFDKELINFNKFLKGTLSLDEVLTCEKPYLYDYVFRMCGQQQLAEKIVDEVINVIKVNPSTFTSFKDLRITLYSTARNFAADSWNADTSKLENAGFNNFSQNNESIDEFILKFIEKQLNILPAQEKEILILEYKYAFGLEDICNILRIPLKNILEFKNNSLKKFENKLKLSTEEIINFIRQIPLHPMKPQSIFTTRAFSEILNEVQFSQRHSISSIAIKVIILIVVLILFLLIFVFKRFNLPL